MSHPVWVRGLKLQDMPEERLKEMSHPVWVRGLKPTNGVCCLLPYCVAPRVGAWIETR